MNAETIKIISKYIDDNLDLSNSELARIIIKDSKLELSEGSLRNYIAKIKLLPKTTNVTLKKELVKIEKELTIHEHIKGYLIAYSDLNFTELANKMHENSIGENYSLGTLRNYIAKNAKEINDNVPNSNKKTNEQIFNEVEKIGKEEIEKICTHEILIVDKFVDPEQLNEYLSSVAQYSQNNSVKNLFSITLFSENVEIMKSRVEDHHVEYEQELSLGISLLDAISTTISTIGSISKKDIVNLTVITSGFDNQSVYIQYDYIKEIFNFLRDNHDWNINLVFVGDRHEESLVLASKIGIDTSNTLFVDDYNEGLERMFNSYKNRILKIRNKEKPILLYFS